MSLLGKQFKMHAPFHIISPTQSLNGKNDARPTCQVDSRVSRKRYKQPAGRIKASEKFTLPNKKKEQRKKKKLSHRFLVRHSRMKEAGLGDSCSCILPPNQVGRSLRGLWEEEERRCVGSEPGCFGRHPHIHTHKQLPSMCCSGSLPAKLPKQSSKGKWKKKR